VIVLVVEAVPVPEELETDEVDWPEELTALPALELEDIDWLDVTPTRGTSDSKKLLAVWVQVSPFDPQPLTEQMA